MFTVGPYAIGFCATLLFAPDAAPKAAKGFASILLSFAHIIRAISDAFNAFRTTEHGCSGAFAATKAVRALRAWLISRARKDRLVAFSTVRTIQHGCFSAFPATFVFLALPL